MPVSTFISDGNLPRDTADALYQVLHDLTAHCIAFTMLGQMICNKNIDASLCLYKDPSIAKQLSISWYSGKTGAAH